MVNYELQIDAILKFRDVSKEVFVEGLAEAHIDAENTRKWIEFYFESSGVQKQIQRL